MIQIPLKFFKALDAPTNGAADSVFIVFGDDYAGLLVTDSDGNVKPIVVDIAVLQNMIAQALTNVHLGGTWGQINGTLSGQSDLAAALAAKSPLTNMINAQTGTSYTLQASDNGKIITFSNSSPVLVSVPPGLGAGFNCRLIQVGTGQVTVAGNGTTIRNRQGHNKIAGQYGTGRLASYVVNEFAFEGDTTKATLLLDLITETASRAYSFRKLRNAYDGYCAKVRPAGSSDAWTNIGFGGNDYFDESAAMAVGENIEILFYDQSGNNNHETKRSSSPLPTVIFNAFNGKAIRQFLGSYVNIGDLSGFTAGEVFRLFKGDATSIASGASNFWHIGTSEQGNFFTYWDNMIYDDFGSSVRRAYTPPTLVDKFHLYSAYSATNSWRAYLDGAALLAEVTDNVVSFNPDSYLFCVNYMFDNEFILFNQKLSSANRQKVWDNLEEFNNLSF